MRPLPFVPNSTVLGFAELGPGRSSRLELWNLDALAGNERLHYITLSAVADDAPDPDPEPLAMITTRLARTPDDEIDSLAGGDRVVPAAQLSILSIPLDTETWTVGHTADRLAISEELLHGLAAEGRPWEVATCSIDDEPCQWWRLTWNDGALWAGEYQDITASVIVRGQPREDLLLRSLTTAEKRQLSEPSNATIADREADGH